MTPTKTQAIQTALMGDWNTAILLNKEILKEIPNDIETLNRLALACTVVGKIKDAKNAYQKVLMLDSLNPIALKSIKRLLTLHKGNGKNTQKPLLPGTITTMFLEENGKTKVIELVNVAEPKIICHLMTGELVLLHVKRLKIFVLDRKDHYIGMLPDDIGKRLIKFLKGGNSYEAYVKAVVQHRVTVFVKEGKRATRFKNQPSFPPTDKSKIAIGGKFLQADRDEKDTEESDTDSETLS